MSVPERAIWRVTCAKFFIGEDLASGLEIDSYNSGCGLFNEACVKLDVCVRFVDIATV